MKRILVGILAVLIFAGGMLAGWVERGLYPNRPARPVRPSFKQVREQTPDGEKKYNYINPLLTCELAEPKETGPFLKLKTVLDDLISRKIQDATLTTASVYFDTRDGRWMGINTGEKYFPASLMKVPAMIAVLKTAESNPAVLAKSATHGGGTDLNAIEYFKPAKTLSPGSSYTVDQLLEYLVAYSDNNAVVPLLQSISDQQLDEVFTDLGIEIPADAHNTLSDFITVKQYANFFRVLYNATYLNREMSEKALGYLSKPDFPQGIEAGVPKDVVVAQKFGERNFGDKAHDLTSPKELHDCGVIYYPDRPYLLCIMTKGHDFEKLAQTISDISKAVYTEISTEIQKK